MTNKSAIVKLQWPLSDCFGCLQMCRSRVNAAESPRTSSRNSVLRSESARSYFPQQLLYLPHDTTRLPTFYPSNNNPHLEVGFRGHHLQSLITLLQILHHPLPASWPNATSRNIVARPLRRRAFSSLMSSAVAARSSKSKSAKLRGRRTLRRGEASLAEMLLVPP